MVQELLYQLHVLPPFPSKAYAYGFFLSYTPNVCAFFRGRIEDKTFPGQDKSSGEGDGVCLHSITVISWGSSKRVQLVLISCRLLHECDAL
jgi:hypothetical protein